MSYNKNQTQGYIKQFVTGHSGQPFQALPSNLSLAFQQRSSSAFFTIYQNRHLKIHILSKSLQCNQTSYCSEDIACHGSKTFFAVALSYCQCLLAVRQSPSNNPGLPSLPISAAVHCGQRQLTAGSVKFEGKLHLQSVQNWVQLDTVF